jgi:hypothetical protein
MQDPIPERMQDLILKQSNARIKSQEEDKQKEEITQEEPRQQ